MKKKVILIVLAVILVLLAIAVLVYTRPRTLDSIIGTEDPVVVFASTSTCTPVYGQIEEDRWQLSDKREHDPAVWAKVMELMGRIKYRLSLRSLTRPNLLTGDHSKVSSNTTIVLAFDNGRIVTVDYLGSAAAISLFDEKGFLIASVVNEGALTDLADYIAQVGEKE